jgi:endoglycosylceramidase
MRAGVLAGIVAGLIAGLTAAPASAAALPGPAARSGERVVRQLEFLHVGGAAGPAKLLQILDPQGREVLLRGVNLTGLRDDYVADGSLKPPYPETAAPYAGGACPALNPGVYMAPVCARDAGQLAAFGYDVVRLTVSWSQLEPQPGHINGAYIDRIAQVVGWLRARGIYSVIDMHDDAWSKYLYTPAGSTCPPPTDPVTGFHEADGAPAWASAHLTPVCAAGGVRDLDAAVQEDFQRLYDNAPGPDGVGLQTHYARAMGALAARFADDPAVAGYEILNEPEPGFAGPGAMDPSELFPFYANVIRTIRQLVPGFRQLFFIEPDVTRDILDRSVVIGPWSLYSPYRNVVYAPHIYTDVFTLNSELGLSELDPAYPPNGGYDTSVRDARALGLPLWVGEFGNGVGQDGTLLANQYANQDRLAVGGALWYWKGQPARDGHWSVLYDDATHTDAAYPSRVEYTDRAYPLATAGRITALSYLPATGAFTMSGTAGRVRRGDRRRATIVYLPASVHGAIGVIGAAAGLLPAPAGARELFVYPKGGSYSVSVTG